MSNCTVKVKSLRVEGVPGVLRLDSRNRLSLHVHWVGADPCPVLPSQVTQELRVPVCGNIAFIKPGRLTGCRRRKQVLTICCALMLHLSIAKNNAGLTFQCSGKESKVWRKNKCLMSYNYSILFMK